jgi:hypothetical protein
MQKVGMSALVQTLCQPEKVPLNQGLGVIFNSKAQKTAGKPRRTGVFVAGQRQHPGRKVEIPFKSSA